MAINGVGDTIFTGSIQLTSLAPQSPQWNTLHKISGNFSNEGIPQNIQLVSGEINKTGIVQFTDNQVEETVNGNINTLNIKYLDGNKKEVNFTSSAIEQSYKEEVFYFLNFSTDNQRIIGDFSSQSATINMKGFVNNQNLIDENFTIQGLANDSGIVVRLFFEKGNLHTAEYISAKNENAVFQVQKTDSLKQIDFQSYLGLMPFIFYQNSNLKLKSMLNNTVNVLKYPIEQTNKIISQFSDFNIEPIQFKIDVNAPVYLIHDEEIKALDSVVNHINQTRSYMHQALLLTSKQNISNHNHLVKAYGQKIKLIKKEILNEFDEILQLHSNNSITYVPAKNIISSSFSFKTRVIDTTQEQKIDCTILPNWSTPDSLNYQVLSEYSGQLKQRCYQITDSLIELLNQFNNESQLVSVQEEINANFQKSHHLIDSLITQTHIEFAGCDYREYLHQLISREISHYSNIEDLNKKIQYADTVLICLADLNRFVYQLSKTTSKIYELKDKYTKTIFNPYTYTNMEDIAKPKIFKAYQKTLLPYLFDDIKNITCHNIQVKSQNFTLLFSAMENLIYADTKKLERQLKNKMSAQEISNILNIGLQF